MYGRWGLSGGGTLTISSNGVVFRLGDGILNPLALIYKPRDIRATQPIVIVRARCLPLGFNSGIVIHGEDTSLCILSWLGDRRSIEARLRAAGVPVIERRTWFTVGVGLARRRGRSSWLQRRFAASG
jgi:hypothetical protein